MYSYLQDQLKLYTEEHGPIKVALAGIGFIGGGLLREMSVLKEYQPSVILYRTEQKLIDQNATCDHPFDLVMCETEEEVIKASTQGKVPCVKEIELMYSIKNDVTVDATGDEEVGAELGYQAITHDCHLVASPEIDITVGPYLSRLASEHNVVYSGFSGDEPGEIRNLKSYVEMSGLKVVAIGKFKRFLDKYADPTSVKKWADMYKQNPVKISSFADGTKMNIEMGIVANSTGFFPDVPGMHCEPGTLETVASMMQLKKDGGVLNRQGVIEIVRDVEPTGGVFVVGHTLNPQMIKDMKYYKMGDGPNYLFYKPYHLCVFEMMMGIGKVVVLKSPVVSPLKIKHADVIPYAKKDLQKGEVLDFIGGYSFYGLLEKQNEIANKRYLPISVVAGCKLTTDKKKDEMITFDDVEFQSESRLISIIKEEYAY